MDKDTKLKKWRIIRKIKPPVMAKLASMTVGNYYKYERGEQSLSDKLITIWTKALNIEANQLIEQAAPLGFDDEGQSFIAKEPLYLAMTNDETGLDLWEITSSNLDMAGLQKGDIALVDSRAGFMDDLETGQIVVAQIYYEDADAPLGQTAQTVFRQFIKPALLITNSARKNQLPLIVGKDDVVIMGAVKSIHRP